MSTPERRPTSSERRKMLHEQVMQAGRLDINVLAKQLEVSVMTIRRDVSELEATGLVRLEQGLVFPEHKGIWELPVTSRLRLNTVQKHRIATTALSMIGPDQTVGIDGSTTCLHIAQAIEGIAGVTVVTNSIPVAATVGNKEGLELIVVGGMVRKDSLTMLGEATEQALLQYSLDIVFLSGLGVDKEKGLTENHLLEIQAKRALIANATRVIVVADSTKLGKVALATSCPASRIDLLISDDRADPKLVEELSAVGIEVVLVESDY